MKNRLNHSIRPGMKSASKTALFLIAFWLGCFIGGILYQLLRTS